MAYIDQFSALTRRKQKSNRVSMINQQAQNLPELLELKSQREHQGKMFDLGEQELASTTAYQNEMLKIDKRNADLAKDLGYANLGVTAAFELAKTETGKKVWDWAGESLGDAADWLSENLFSWI